MAHCKDSDYSFINCDFPYSAILEAAYLALVEAERVFFIETLIRYIDFVVFSGVFEKGNSENINQDATSGDEQLKIVEALNAVRYCLRDPICQDEMWTWLHRVMVQLDSPTKAAFTVGVFCPILSTPLAWDNQHEMVAIDRLMQCYTDTARKWIVMEGFSEGSYKQAVATLNRYNNWRHEQGREPLTVDYSELEQYFIVELAWTEGDWVASEALSFYNQWCLDHSHPTLNDECDRYVAHISSLGWTEDAWAAWTDSEKLEKIMAIVRALQK